MTDSDFNAFKRIQKAYFARVCSEPDSLLARIYGIYSVKMENQDPVRLIVMGNSMKLHKHVHIDSVSNPDKIKGIFDVKGSMVNRMTKGELKPTKTLKDKNLLKLAHQNKNFFRFAEKDRKRILKVMAADVAILCRFNLMDYSLLLCI